MFPSAHGVVGESGGTQFCAARRRIVGSFCIALSSFRWFARIARNPPGSLVLLRYGSKCQRLAEGMDAVLVVCPVRTADIAFVDAQHPPPTVPRTTAPRRPDRPVNLE